ncbi:MAG: hypothetical protein KJO22_03790 [Bacteroidia bacterium]|nr:hypothetical protein [Bacteroidia bacterium]
MKTIKYILGLFVVIIISCSEDDINLNYLNSIQAPSNVSALFEITQDNSGLVRITPNSEGGVNYNVSLGDGSGEPISISQGENVEHIYAEGTYTVGIEAIGITGLSTTVSQDLVVSFRAPENLEITAQTDPSNPFIINVSATADFAASFLVYFDTSNPDEEGTPLGLDEIVSFEYAAVGDYTIRVVALSGGTETTELTQDVTISSPVELPIDFEVFDASVFQGFGGATNAVIDNPDPDGNDSAKVGQIIKGAGETWAGNVITLSSPIDFTTKKVIKMDIWSPRPGGRVLLKVENLDDSNIFFEKEVMITGASTWEEVSFDLSEIDTANSYQKIVLFFDFGDEGDGSADWTFYIDNLKQTVPSTGSFLKLMVEDFEDPTPTLLPFGNNTTAEVITLDDLPAGTGNVTENVAKLVKGSGAQVWAGVTLPLDEPLDLDTYSNISVKTWSPKVGAIVMLKIETDDPNVFVEVQMTTTVANAWEELVYDFSEAPSETWTKLIAFFDFGIEGDDSTYYFDDYQLTNNGTPQSLIENFEAPAPTLLPFGNNTTAEVITLDDLPAGTDNVTENVAKLVKGAGAQVWAGVTLPLDEPLDLDTYSSISVKTWSPKIDAVVMLKIETDDPNVFWEVQMTTTVSGAWEELIYDFSEAPSETWTKLIAFFDFGIEGDDSTYYFDDYILTD